MQRTEPTKYFRPKRGARIGAGGDTNVAGAAAVSEYSTYIGTLVYYLGIGSCFGVGRWLYYTVIHNAM